MDHHRLTTWQSLEHRTIQTVTIEENHEQLQSLITHELADIQRCYHSLLRREPIALFIGEQQMVFRNGAGTLTHMNDGRKAHLASITRVISTRC